jgi:hypothetical protein
MLNREQRALLEKIKELGTVYGKTLTPHENRVAGQLAAKGFVEIDTKETFIGIVTTYTYVKG